MRITITRTIDVPDDLGSVNALETLVREEGFEMAFTCLDGHSLLPGSDNHQIRRTGITTRTTELVFRVRLTVPGGYLDRWRHRRQAVAPAAGGPGLTASCARKA